MIRTLQKKLLLLAILATLLLMMLFYSTKTAEQQTKPINKLARPENNAPPASISSEKYHFQRGRFIPPDKEFQPSVPSPPLSPSQAMNIPQRASSNDMTQQCPRVQRAEADMETSEILPTLNFDADWIESREYWNDKMERRYEKRRKEFWKRVPLKVIVMPHSHNDPGWLKTFEGYYNSATKAILDNAVDKLSKNKEMTFVWTEMSFLSKWYESAHDTRKAKLNDLLEEGRFEILTGGWVMTDEANVDIWGMVDQLIEGHQWLKDTLNVTCQSSWSVDPFGHGGTFPYVLNEAGLNGMLIMRIHYAWKEWFAREQQGDFLWRQNWDPAGKHDILCHNFPYDIYSIKGSCGPHSQVCLEFNFKKVPGDYNEYVARYNPVNAQNIKERAELLLTQYGKTGSLFPHNVVLVPLGDDFTYNNAVEWDQQYANYKMLMDFINSNRDTYHAEVQFGTLSDYFKEVRRRQSSFDTLHGDFYVYADVFSEGRPAYWSGYYSTRPFMKQLVRRAQAHLRAAEILYTMVLNQARQSSQALAIDKLEELYPSLVSARRNVALFQHHDAITGTSKQFVMHDYGLKLYEAILSCRNIEKHAMQQALSGNPRNQDYIHLKEDFHRRDYSEQPTPVPIDLNSARSGNSSAATYVVYNPLAEKRREVLSIFLEGENSKDVCVLDQNGNVLEQQINPTWNVSGFFRLDISFVELTFLATLEPLSVTKFTLLQDKQRCQKPETSKKPAEVTQVFCLRCPQNKRPGNHFDMAPIPEGAIQLENAHFVLIFDEEHRLLTSVKHKNTGTEQDLELQFAAYPTSQFRSGAYLFKPAESGEENVVVFNEEDLKEVVVISGALFSEVSLIYETGGSASHTGARNHNRQQQQTLASEPGSFVHTVRLYHTGRSDPTSRGIYIENNFNFGDSENHRDIDLFMRLNSKIRNGKKTPVFYSDQSGFQVQKRSKVDDIGIEGNYYPITTMTFIEDEELRLSLLVEHATGAAAWKEGWLEVMVDRRSSFDDARGMGEGVLDSRETTHKYWLLFEPKPADHVPMPSQVELPSEVAQLLSRRLNYPTVQYYSLAPAATFKKPQVSYVEAALPCDRHLFNLRTLSKPTDPLRPSREALLIFHRQSSDCSLHNVLKCNSSASNVQDWALGGSEGPEAKSLRKTSLTGVREHEVLASLEDLIVDQEPMSLDAVKVSF